MPESQIPEISFDDKQTQTSLTEPKAQVVGRRFPFKKVLLGFLVVLILIFAVGFFFVFLPAQKFISSAKETMALSRETYTHLKEQDIGKTQESLLKTKDSMAKTKQAFGPLLWTKNIPLAGSYTSDLEHGLNAATYGLDSAEILVKAIVPYADLLGLKGSGTFAGGTAEDRIAKAVETLSKVTPQIDEIAVKFDSLKKEVDAIDPKRYPETFQGRQVRSQLVSAKQLLLVADDLLTNARPLVKKLPDLMGAQGESKYMVIFQNDKELRPTGGFITAYAVFRIEKGRIHLEAADDIYKLDDTITKKVTPPDPIAKYLNVYGWRIRDSNFSPDFSSSMKVFEDLYASSSQKKKIDGIIALDTQVLVDLMKVTGPVNAYGMTFTTDKVAGCDCPMVVYELLKAAGTPRGYLVDNRKDIIGVLMQELLKKTLSAPKQIVGNLAPVMLSEISTKHLLVYLNDADAQSGIEAIGASGSIKRTPEGMDYLHVNDANLGGAKTNLYVKEKVTLNVETSKDGTTNTLVLEYQNPHPADNCSLERKEGLCLSGIYRDYVRLYLPTGSKLVESKGFETKSTAYDDLGHSVIDGFFTMTPLGLVRLQIKYTTPVKFSSGYKLFLQKQPGTVGNHYKITLNGSDVKELDLTTDTEVDFN